MSAEDEPFEFFSGFAEVFVSIGLVILMTGLLMLVGVFAFAWGNDTAGVVILAVAAVLAWVLALYFTLKRRMNLPSMVLTLVFGGAICLGVATLLMAEPQEPSRLIYAAPPLVATLAMALWYRQFRLPFSMFVLGGFALVTLYTLTATPEAVFQLMRSADDDLMNSFFDLSRNPVFALATLGFGVTAFLAGMWFDMRDPHRLCRHAATAFWLHLLAAFALVNTVAVSLHSAGGMAMLVLALMVITILALVIDRRSFVSAATAYMAIVIITLTGSDDFTSWPVALLILGALITAIGTWWVQLRGWLMRRLPDFPGKDRLPPYNKA
ncbi:hypothetical protein HOY34_03520 [Xinfangfangia sp. D13-10-4-6]|nr:hypothetical protein [Pseudogemmobacter hezensis]